VARTKLRSAATSTDRTLYDLYKAWLTFKAKCPWCCRPSLRLFTFDQSSALDVTYHTQLPVLPALEEVMENFSELMHAYLKSKAAEDQEAHI
jgi:hypothetical protein